MNHKPSTLTVGTMLAAHHASYSPDAVADGEPLELKTFKATSESPMDDPGFARWFNNRQRARQALVTRPKHRPKAEKKARALKRKNTRRNRNK